MLVCITFTSLGASLSGGGGGGGGRHDGRAGPGEGS